MAACGVPSTSDGSCAFKVINKGLLLVPGLEHMQVLCKLLSLGTLHDLPFNFPEVIILNGTDQELPKSLVTLDNITVSLPKLGHNSLEFIDEGTDRITLLQLD